MYEVQIYTTLDGIDGEIHMMSQCSIKTYEEALEAAARIEALGFRPIIKQEVTA
jgi:hypothetical protein